MREQDRPTTLGAASSERQLQPELNLPGVGRCGINGSRIAGLRAVRIEYGTVIDRGIEVRVVDDVENFGAKFQIQSLADFRFLNQRKIEIEHSRPGDFITAASPEQI